MAITPKNKPTLGAKKTPAPAAKAAAAAPAPKKAAPAPKVEEAGENPVVKNDIVSAIVAAVEAQFEAGKITRNVAECAYDAVMGAVSGGLAAGRSVRLHQIGILKVRRSPARVARNPRTGEPIDVPARGEVRFSPSKVLKDAVAGAGA